MKLAFVFPGQGSQAVGMLKGYDGLPEMANVLDEAAGVLGADFVRLMDHGPAEALNQTVNTQPAMVTGTFHEVRFLPGPATLPDRESAEEWKWASAVVALRWSWSVWQRH